jgi:hypothetical protein
MLLKLIVLSLESKHKLLGSNLTRVELNVEGVISFRHNRVVHRSAFKGECFVSDCVKSNGSGDLSLVLEHDLHIVILVDTGASELEHRGTISLKFVELGYLKSWQSAFTSNFEAHLTLFRVELTFFDDCFEDTAILLHLCGVEVDSYVLVLIRNDLERLWLDFKCETFRLRHSARLDRELNIASDLVGVHNLEAL